MDAEQIEKVKDMLNSLDLNSFNQSLIKDNKIIFIVDNYVYRCKMPCQKDLALAEDLENRLKVEYAQKENYVTKSKWKKILKEKQDIDIDFLEEEKEKLQGKMKDVYLDIAATQTSEKETLAKLKEKKKEIEKDIIDIIILITDSLSPCIEEVVKKKYYEYLTHKCTEKCIENDEWEPVWKSLEEYENDSSKIAHNALAYLQTLLLNVRDN